MANGKSAVVPARAGASPDAGPSDRELLIRFNSRRDGSAEAAFETLVRRHGPMVLRTCGQVLADCHGAEDAFQATFLILARKSGSIRCPELLGNWLYGVALRTAREAKMRDGRRRQLEAPGAEGGPREPAVEAGRAESSLIRLEEFEALHEEVARLPERYRVPVVLCEMEGLTYEEVAKRMSCPVGTIGVRLSRARDRLRSRLIRRGIVPAAALVDAVFGPGGAAALMSSTLIDSTVRGASIFAAGDFAVLGGVSATAFALTHAVLGAMALARLKVATGSVLVVALGAAITLVAIQGRSWLPPVAGPSKVAPNRVESSPSIVVAPAIPDQPPRDTPTAADPVEVAPIVEAPEEGKGRPRPLPAPAGLKRLALEERARGEVLFFKEWAANDPASPHGDGLGPVFNESSCVACHGLGAPGGAGPEGKNVVILTAILGGRRRPKGLEQVHPGFLDGLSTVLHRYGTDPTYASWRSHLVEGPDGKAQAAGLVAGEEPVAARIRRVAEQVSPKGRARERSPRLNGVDGISLAVSERNAPALFGAGQIDAISSELIVREAKWQPDEVRGKVSRDRDGRVGRFGWKAQVSRLHEFVRVACAGELGLEVPGHSQSASPVDPKGPAKGLDLTDPECDALVAFVRSLPAPVAIDPGGPLGTEGMAEGRRLFAEVGCASCHAPSLGEVRGIYSDLLLHDMGAGLRDSGEYYGSVDPSFPGGPSPGEWRTPPLWGYRDSGPYLHDGRAETLEEAVALHGGQGTKSAHRFFALEPDGRSTIQAFLKSLVAPSAASAPGIVLAAELESRFVPDEERQAESLVRARRDQAEAQEVRRLAEARRLQVVEVATKRASTRFQMAINLERSGKVAKALTYYRQIAGEVPDLEAGRQAAARIVDLLGIGESP